MTQPNILRIPDSPRRQFLFPDTKLPAFLDIESYEIPHNYLGERPKLPAIRNVRSAIKKRGAPVKLKNKLVSRYKVRNTNGKPFKFSFVPQILVSQLHHMFQMKKKSRYQRDRWLRSYTPQGQRIQEEIVRILDGRTHLLKFKRTVSIKELRDWLRGTIYIDEASPEEACEVRMKVFRLCLLYTSDAADE